MVCRGLVCIVLIGLAASLDAQALAWLQPGWFVGGQGQLRLHDPAYSLGYDGTVATVIQSGDRIDLPTLHLMAGVGAVVGYTSIDAPQEPALLTSVRYSLARGTGKTAVGTLAFTDHEVGLDLELLLDLAGGWALTGQIGWDLELLSVYSGFLPAGRPRTDLLVTSWLGLDGGIGVAYVISRRLLLEARAVLRGFNNDLASGGGATDSLGGELGRFEYSFELMAGWVL